MGILTNFAYLTAKAVPTQDIDGLKWLSLVQAKPELTEQDYQILQGVIFKLPSVRKKIDHAIGISQIGSYNSPKSERFEK